jgi:hypothetical protein
VFSFPCFLKGLPGETEDLWIIDSSAFIVDDPKYDSSTAKVLLFPGDSGVSPPCWQLNLVGLPKVAGANFKALSKATGRSIAPGGLRLLLGLPCGVCTGVIKLFLVGVLGRSLKVSFWSPRVWRGGGGAGKLISCFPLWEDVNRFAMKLDML